MDRGWPDVLFKAREFVWWCQVALRVDLSKFNNAWYQPGRGLLIRLLWIFLSALFVQCAWNPSSAFRVMLLRLFGAQVGQGVVIKPGVQVKYPWRLEVGDHVWIGEGAWIDNLADVKIGSHSCLSQGCYLLTGNHDYRSTAFDLRVGAIVLEDGAWVGAKAIVCPGVTVGEEAVLAVGSVLSSDADAAMVYRGNPAVPVKQRYPEGPA